MRSPLTHQYSDRLLASARGGPASGLPPAAAPRLARACTSNPAISQLIVQAALFAGLDVRRLGPLLAQATLRRFERDAILFLQDEPATRFYVVLDG